MRRSRTQLAALLAAVWIVTIAPGLPGPVGGPSGLVPRLFGTFPDWRDDWLALGGHIGSVVAALIWGMWAAAVGALKHAPALPPPLAEWCPYARYARHRECEVYLTDSLANGAYSIESYAYTGARCVPEANLRLPSPREHALAIVDAGLRRAFETTGVVERDGRVGDVDVDFIVERHAGDQGTPLVAIDVLAETNRRRAGERAN